MSQFAVAQSQKVQDSIAITSGVLQRKCDKCQKKKPLLQRSAIRDTPITVPPIVHEVLRSPGQPLDSKTRAFMEPRFGHDFSRVRVHTDAKAAESARAVNALAYTVGHDMVFGVMQHSPQTTKGTKLLAHELTHVIQQGSTYPATGQINCGSATSPEERNAEEIGNAVVEGRIIGPIAGSAVTLQRRAAPYIKKITVHLEPPQSAELEWEGTAPDDAAGSDSFTVSTGKGYSDPDPYGRDPPGTCTRTCCKDPMTQCAPPWNQPGRVGACCTYYGNNFWTGTPQEEHNGWKWWTPIQPYYSSRGIALHQHDKVTGQPIGHGCVRMEEPNAKRIFDFSNGRRTNVTIDGRAAPVLCDRTCDQPTSSGSGATSDEALAVEDREVVPGLEGEMT
jgi:hypothetical protein